MSSITIVKVLPFPSVKSLSGNVKTLISPIDLFFLVALGPIIQRPDISFDPKKIHLSNYDGRYLFALFKIFMVKVYPIDGHSVAADIWIKVGPSLSSQMPEGFIGFEEGYLKLEEE